MSDEKLIQEAATKGVDHVLERTIVALLKEITDRPVNPSSPIVSDVANALGLWRVARAANRTEPDVREAVELAEKVLTSDSPTETEMKLAAALLALAPDGT